MQPEWIEYRQRVTPILKEILANCDSTAYLDGRTYLYKGNVEKVWLDKGIFYATIKGKNHNKYQCSFNIQNKNYHCSCPSYRDICKHIVAMTFYLIDIRDWRAIYLQSISSSSGSPQAINNDSIDVNQIPVISINSDNFQTYRIKIKKSNDELVAIGYTWELKYLLPLYRPYFERVIQYRHYGEIDQEFLQFLVEHPEVPVQLSNSKTVHIETKGTISFKLWGLDNEEYIDPDIDVKDKDFLKRNKFVLLPYINFQNFSMDISFKSTYLKSLLVFFPKDTINGRAEMNGKDILGFYVNLSEIEVALKEYANHLLPTMALYEFKSKLSKKSLFHSQMPDLPEPFAVGPRLVIDLSAFEGETNIKIKGKIHIAYSNHKNAFNILNHEKKGDDRKSAKKEESRYALFRFSAYQRDFRSGIVADENGVVAKRNATKEYRLTPDISSLKYKKSTGEFELGPRQVTKFVENIFPDLEEAGVLVRIPENLAGIFSQEHRAAFKVESSSEIDWFGKIEFDNVSDADRKILMEAATKNEEFSRLSDGKWVSVNSTGLKKIFNSLNNAGFDINAEGEVEHLNKGDLIALSKDLDTRGDARYTQMIDNFKNIRDIPAEKLMDTGKNILVELRDYQKEGVAFLRRLYEWKIGGILADDMGLGKTMQALAFLNWLTQEKRSSLVLIVGPVASLSVWNREAVKYFPGLNVSLWHGASRRNSEPAKHGILLTSYGVLLRDAEILKEMKFDVIIADEAQIVKNVFASTTRALSGLKTEVFYCMSGTPMENHIGECWSLMNLSFPGLLGRRKQFMQRFSKKNDEEKNIQWFKNRTTAFLLRRTKGDVLKDLPPRNEILVPVPMTDTQKKAHDNTRIAALASMEATDDKKLFVLLRFLMKMRRIACHPDLGNHEHTQWNLSGKMEYLRDVIEELNETASGILIFSQYTDLLKLVSRMFDSMQLEYFYLDGSTPAGKREKLTDAFQKGDRKIFLISLKAGGTALTLTQADTVIHLDPWWNPAAENQASDRAHRIGQSRPVFIYKLVSSGSIEEKVIALQEKKKKLFSTLFDGGTFNSSHIAVEELLGLLEEE
ncbi:MAG: DEAD/DEAH box helicase [Spirochaetia bacterium]|nr:DEAD/DEAH box helicase [Spirochaetia bacterium]